MAFSLYKAFHHMLYFGVFVVMDLAQPFRRLNCARFGRIFGSAVCCSARQVSEGSRERGCGGGGHPYTPRALKVRLPPRWTVVAASGASGRVDYVAAELPADRPRIFHEPDAAGVLPAEA